MKTYLLSLRKAEGLINSLRQVKRLRSQSFINIMETRLFLTHLKKSAFMLMEFNKREKIVHLGQLRNNRFLNFQYALAPLGIILKGEVVVLENGKGVKRLFPGDFIGLFETAHYLSLGRKRKIGNWTLVADENTAILFFGDVFSNQRFKSFLIDLARLDIVPKPITDLPLLDWVANNTTISLIENSIIITHTHILPSSFPLFRHLAHLVDYDNLFILEKPYSTVRRVFNKLIQMGAEIVPVAMVDHAPYEFALKRSIDVLWDKVINIQKRKNISRIIVIDDGADLLLSIPWEKLKSVKIVGVEQTQRGIDRINNTRHNIPAVVNVASSAVKKNIESLFIGKAIVQKMKSLRLLKSFPKVSIIGIGSIGRAISKELKKNNIDVISYDIKHHVQRTSDKTKVNSIDTAINKSDIVVGCSGSDFLKGVALERIEGKKTLISASSSDIEYFSLLNLVSFPNRTFEEIKIKVHSSLKLKILNGGYPINFDRKKEWESSEDIQITRCLLYIGIMQSLTLTDSRYRGKIVKLDGFSQEELIKKWVELKRVKTYRFLTELKEKNISFSSISEGEYIDTPVWLV